MYYWACWNQNTRAIKAAEEEYWRDTGLEGKDGRSFCLPHYCDLPSCHCCSGRKNTQELAAMCQPRCVKPGIIPLIRCVSRNTKRKQEVQVTFFLKASLGGSRMTDHVPCLFPWQSTLYEFSRILFEENNLLPWIHMVEDYILSGEHESR